jgi:HlyD family secretion protein
VEVLVADGEGGMEARRGSIRWISGEAEFTPSTVQTRDERAELVYAFEVRVPNADGSLRIGMPGEVRFVPRGER